jgi:hypothetical protein
LFGGERRTSEKPKFNVEDQVRISLSQGIFAKMSTEQSFSDEIFTIKRIKLSDPIIYFIEDLDKHEILGSFYKEELTKVKKGEEDYWEIEKVIKSRIKNGKREYFIKFRGYDNKHNRWVSDLKRK